MGVPPVELKKGLSQRHLTMIAIGGVIGAGLFVGSGAVIKDAGPAAFLTYAVTGVLIIMVMRMLGEMAVANPSTGSFADSRDSLWVLPFVGDRMAQRFAWSTAARFVSLAYFTPVGRWVAGRDSPSAGCTGISGSLSSVSRPLPVPRSSIIGSMLRCGCCP